MSENQKAEESQLEKSDQNVEEEKSVEEKVQEQLIERIRKGSQIVKACEKHLIENIKISGRTLEDWGQSLRVSMPNDPDDIIALERAQSSVSDNIQLAEYLLANQEIRLKAMNSTHEKAFATRYVMQMRENKKIAAEKLKQQTLLDETVDSSLSASQVLETTVDYFKRIIHGLEETRKGIENRVRLINLRLYHKL